MRASCEGSSEGRLTREDRNVADTEKRNTERELGKVNANLEEMVMKAQRASKGPIDRPVRKSQENRRSKDNVRNEKPLLAVQRTKRIRG